MILVASWNIQVRYPHALLLKADTFATLATSRGRAAQLRMAAHWRMVGRPYLSNKLILRNLEPEAYVSGARDERELLQGVL